MGKLDKRWSIASYVQHPFLEKLLEIINCFWKEIQQMQAKKLFL